ncbi:MAG TPA: DUF362 domain-containing protein [Candidatus Deferrimicrobium sp.]|nr:DUF362 domain-containing protein [Candidatus Deferrimicrobium sp.]
MPVSIVRSKIIEVDAKLRDALELIKYQPKKDKIFLKPNIVDAANPKLGVTTHPKVVEALLNYFQGFSKEVVIGEGTGFFNTDEKFKKLVKESGYSKLEKEYGIEIINLEQTERVEKTWKYGTLALPKLLDTHEYVNVPTMKTHMQCTVTLAMKNQKGLLKVSDKKKFHQTDLNGMIRELATIAIPDLIVMNAIYCCEATGPAVVGSKPKQMDLLLAGTDIVEVDNVSARIMGFDPANIPHIPVRPTIDVRGLSIEEVQSPFEAPKSYLQIKNIYAYSDDKACTSCSINLSRAAQKIFFTPELLDQLEKKGNIDLLLGTRPMPENPSPTVICVGKCAKKTAELHHLPLINGCPPDYREIINFLFDNYYERKIQNS